MIYKEDVFKSSAKNAKAGDPFSRIPFFSSPSPDFAA